MYSYNSYHKIITAVVLIGWVIYHFSGTNDSEPVYDNGNVIRTGEKQDNLNHGSWIWYYDNGQIQLEGEFLKGKRTGLWKRYNMQGDLVSKFYYKNDKLEGLYVVYDSSGEEIAKYRYANDKIVETLIKRGE